MTGWEELWREGVTPWDLGDVSPPLQEFLNHTSADGVVASGDKVLVPGCGRGYDLKLLANSFKRVIGLDISETAVAAARLENASHSNVTIERGDFFTHPHHDYDGVYDYTFFCAIDPKQRDAWAQKMKQLVRPSGLLMCIVFPIIEAPSRGYPPHPVSLDDYKRRLQPEFSLVHFNKSPKSHASRVGKEMMAVFRRL